MSNLVCPKNGCDLREKPIPEKHFDPALHEVDPERHARNMESFGKCFCLPYGDKPPEERFYSKLIGIEDGTYDGVSWWHCPVCGVTWNRWTGEERPADEDS